MSAPTFLSRFRLRTKIIVSAAVLIIAAAAVWIFVFLLPSQNAAAQTATRTAEVGTQTLQQTVESSGTVTPAVQDDVDFAVSGTVTAVDVTEGQTVAAGDVLATVDTLQLNADLLQAQADLADAKASLADAEDAGSSDARIAAASASVDVAQASVASAKTALGNATLRAPSAGLVTTVGVAVGDRISGSGSGSGSSGGSGSTPAATGTPGGSSASSTTTSSAAFTIVGTDAWSLDVSVGETDISHIEKGQQVELSSDDGTQYFGTVSEVGLVPSTSSGSAQYAVSVMVTGDGKGLYDGVSLDASIVYERRTDVLAVPSAAVTTADGTSTVLVVGADGAQTATTVKTGETAGGYTEITSGLSEGDTIVVASFTPGQGNSGSDGKKPSGGFPGGGEMPSGGFPGGGLPGNGEMPSGGLPGGSSGNGGQR